MTLTISNPDWLADLASSGTVYPTDDDRMRLVVRLAVENVERQTGGPFAAAVFSSTSGTLVAAGVNSVVRLRNSVLHAEVMALMLAEAARVSYSLADGYELVTSCDPCAMCLGATLWSGVRRLVCGATREDAMTLGFDEGPVFPESYAYLARSGIEVIREVCRADAQRPFDRYRESGGVIYNG